LETINLLPFLNTVYLEQLHKQEGDRLSSKILIKQIDNNNKLRMYEVRIDKMLNQLESWLYKELAKHSLPSSSSAAAVGAAHDEQWRKSIAQGKRPIEEGMIFQKNFRK
jgi:hypothetical protein